MKRLAMTCQPTSMKRPAPAAAEEVMREADGLFPPLGQPDEGEVALYTGDGPAELLEKVWDTTSSKISSEQ